MGTKQKTIEWRDAPARKRWPRIGTSWEGWLWVRNPLLAMASRMDEDGTRRRDNLFKRPPRTLLRLVSTGLAGSFDEPLALGFVFWFRLLSWHLLVLSVGYISCMLSSLKNDFPVSVSTRKTGLTWIPKLFSIPFGCWRTDMYPASCILLSKISKRGSQGTVSPSGNLLNSNNKSTST